MPQHPNKPVKSKQQRHAERPTGKLPPGSEGQPSSPRIGVTVVKRG